jgi:hypothetical protein
VPDVSAHSQIYCGLVELFCLGRPAYSPRVFHAGMICDSDRFDLRARGVMDAYLRSELSAVTQVDRSLAFCSSLAGSRPGIRIRQTFALCASERAVFD